MAKESIILKYIYMSSILKRFDNFIELLNYLFYKNILYVFRYKSLGYKRFKSLRLSHYLNNLTSKFYKY